MKSRKLAKEVTKEAKQQLFGRIKFTKAGFIIAILVLISIFILYSIFSYMLGKPLDWLWFRTSNWINELRDQKPKVLLSIAVGQQIIEPRDMEVYGEDFLILKLPKNEFKFINVLKSDKNFHGLINDLYFNDKECLECIHFTIRVTNIGRVKIKEITIEADTYTNKIKFLQTDPKIECSKNTGTYGYGKIYCKVSELDVKERTSFNIQIDNLKKNIPFTCLITDEKTCNLEFFYYQTGLFDPKSLNYHNTTIIIPENLKEGFYKLDRYSGGLIPLKATVISESFEK